MLLPCPLNPISFPWRFYASFCVSFFVEDRNRLQASPFVSTEITASLCWGGGYFFFVTSKTTVTTPRITRQNWNSSEYVTISISPFLQGGQPPATVCSSTLSLFYHGSVSRSRRGEIPLQSVARRGEKRRGKPLLFYLTVISSYWRLPIPIFSACARVVSQLVSGILLWKWS